MDSRQIPLTAPEMTLLSRIDFSPSRSDGGSSWTPIGDASLALVESLVARKGIPARRLRLFTDPACYVGGRGRSHLETFARNGTWGDDVFRHPHFVLNYLRFIVHGPNLPAPLIASFEEEIRLCGDITSGDIPTLCSAAKRLSRKHGLDHRSAEEFFRLALDCNLDPGDARAVRDCVLRMR